MQRTCAEAVSRTLLLSSVSAFALEGCGGAALSEARTSDRNEHAGKSGTGSSHTSKSSAVTPESSTTGDALTGAPILRGAPITIASNAAFAPFPCAIPPLSDAEHEALMARGDEAYNLESGLRYKSELAFRARGLALADDLDSLEIRRVMLAGDVRHQDESVPIVSMQLAEAGTPCRTAQSPEACAEKVKQERKALLSGLECKGDDCPEFDFTYALTTHGDDVRIYRSNAGLAELFGSIDTSTEAWILLVSQKLAHQFECENAEYARHRSIRAGFELQVRMTTSRCRPVSEDVMTYRVNRDGKISLVGQRIVSNDPERCVVSGRRPAGLVPRMSQSPQTAGELLGRMAYLEAASVVAFERLAVELYSLGADSSLLRRVHTAREDELRHAEVMGALALRFGHSPTRPSVTPHALRTIFAVALENAVEGCVRELYGALVARFQLQRAGDLGLRAGLRDIADDEAAHAALSWDIASWLRPQLSAQEQIEIDRSVQTALRDLAQELCEPSADQRELCGMPSLGEAHHLLQELAGIVAARLA